MAWMEIIGYILLAPALLFAGMGVALLIVAFVIWLIHECAESKMTLALALSLLAFGVGMWLLKGLH